MIETEIGRNPSFWFWFHNRWKTRPEKEADPAISTAERSSSEG
jgi:lauroyl/myristoyl acyltransferase